MPEKTAAAAPLAKFSPVPPGHAWAAAIHALGKLVLSLGGDPEAVFRAARVEAGLLSDSCTYLPIAVRGELIAQATIETGCEHFGLSLGSRSDIGQIGILGDVMLSRPTVGLALEALETFWCLHTPAVVVFVRRPARTGETHASVSYAVLDGNLPGMAQLHDGAMAMSLNVMRGLLGAGWSPTAVRLMRREPRDPGLYASFFGADCSFNAPHSELLFPAETLDLPLNERMLSSCIANAEKILFDALSARLSDEGWTEHVYRAVHRLLLQGECSQARLAEVLGISNRTLVRKLGAFGVSYQQCVERARFSLCRTLIKETDMSLLDIAHLLGYNEASSLTRAFHRWSGMSPSQWRRSRS